MASCIYGFFTSNAYAAPRVRRTRPVSPGARAPYVVAEQIHPAYTPRAAKRVPGAPEHPKSSVSPDPGDPHS